DWRQRRTADGAPPASPVRDSRTLIGRVILRQMCRTATLRHTPPHSATPLAYCGVVTCAMASCAPGSPPRASRARGRERGGQARASSGHRERRGRSGSGGRWPGPSRPGATRSAAACRARRTSGLVGEELRDVVLAGGGEVVGERLAEEVHAGLESEALAGFVEAGDDLGLHA